MCVEKKSWSPDRDQGSENKDQKTGIRKIRWMRFVDSHPFAKNAKGWGTQLLWDSLVSEKLRVRHPPGDLDHPVFGKMECSIKPWCADRSSNRKQFTSKKASQPGEATAQQQEARRLRRCCRILRSQDLEGLRSDRTYCIPAYPCKR